jgi:sugar lactone lactonase YvrE
LVASLFASAATNYDLPYYAGTFAGSVFGDANGQGAAAQFAYPRGIAIDSDGTIFVCDTINRTIRKITADGSVTLYAGTSGIAGSVDGLGSSARFQSPSAVAIDPDHNVYIADQHTIRRITPDRVVSTYAGVFDADGWVDGNLTSARFSEPSGLTFGPDGSMYVSDTGNHTVRKLKDGVVTTIAGTANQAGSVDGHGALARFKYPVGIVADAANNLYVADSGNRTVRKITPAGDVTTFAGLAGEIGTDDDVGSSARFRVVDHLAIDETGNVFVTDNNAATVRKISSTGKVTTVAGTPFVQGNVDGVSGVALFSFPSGIALAPSGVLFVADQFNANIRKLIAAPTIVSQPESQSAIAGSSLTLAVTAVGDDLKYQWFKNGVLLAGSSTRTLDLANLQASSAGDYYGEVFNRAGVTRTATAVIAVSYAAPTISSSPVSVNAKLGATATFSVSAHGALSYQWTKDGQAVAGATSSTLAFSRVLPSDAGDYRVSVSNAGATVLSAMARLAVSYSRLRNVSGRCYVGTGENVSIVGIVVAGTGKKRVLIRAAGPGLSGYLASGTLSDPKLVVYSSSQISGINDNWSDDSANEAAVIAAVASCGAGPWLKGSKDAALVTALAPGAHTVVVSGSGTSEGMALIEIFEVDAENYDSWLTNLSCRALVKTGDDVGIVGVVVAGTTNKNLVVRAAGPALAQQGVGAVLPDPYLRMYKGPAALVVNNEWDAGLAVDFKAVGALAWTNGSKDSAVLLSVEPGAYTAVVHDVTGSTGVGLMEIYDADVQ